METVRTVELFAGVGGFRLGLEVASDRYKVIWANQWEPSDSEQCAFGCYTAHFGPREEYVCRDITKVRASVPDHDLLVGGFPCQDYSVARTLSQADGIEGQEGACSGGISIASCSSSPRRSIACLRTLTAC